MSHLTVIPHPGEILLRDLASVIAELRDSESDSWQLQAASSAPDSQYVVAAVLLNFAEQGSPDAQALLRELGALP